MNEKKVYMNEYNILRFDIPMNNFMFMHVHESLNYFPGEKGHCILFQLGLFFHHIIELSITAQFHEQIDIIGVIKETIEFD